MQNTAPLPKLLERNCPSCSAKLDSDLPYCGACGFGLPLFPRPKPYVVCSTALFFFVVVPCGLAAMYCLTFALMGQVYDMVPAVVFAVVCLGLARFMLKMDRGVRRSPDYLK